MNVVRYQDLIPRMRRDSEVARRYDVYCLGALKDAGREFCSQSEAWVEDLTAINIVASQQSYTLTTGYIADFKAIRELHLLSSTEVTAGKEGTLIDRAYYDLVLPATLRFKQFYTPTTAVTSGMVVKMVFVPTMNTVELPDWIMSRWGDAIIARAMWDLFKTDDPAKADVHLRHYNQKVSEAMVQGMADISPSSGSTIIQIQEYTP